MPSETLSAETLKQILEYNPDTGIFRWKKSLAPKIKPGQKAGYYNSRGYLVIKIYEKSYKAHRLAFLYQTGKFPGDLVDHRNGAKGDNRWINLREGDASLNSQNIKTANSRSKTGLLGVASTPNPHRFIAKIHTNGKVQYLGTFDSPEEAHQRYLEEKRKQHKGCTI